MSDDVKPTAEDWERALDIVEERARLIHSLTGGPVTMGYLDAIADIEREARRIAGEREKR